MLGMQIHLRGTPKIGIDQKRRDAIVKELAHYAQGDTCTEKQ